MSARRPIGAPTRSDLHRLREARRFARATVADAEARCAAERLLAFRRELAATVRAASPVLISLLEGEGLSIGDIADRLVPTPGWPSRPRLSRVVGGWGFEPHALRHALAAIAVGRFPKEREMLNGVELALKGGGWAVVRALGHSMEVKARIGAVTFETRYGELRITVPGSMPLALAAGAKGRLLDDLLLSPLTAGRGWRVAGIEHGAAKMMVVVITSNVSCSIG